MEERDFFQNAGLMIYLVSCAVNQQKPDADKLKGFDPEQLFEVCQTHILTACAAYALESAGIQNPAFREAKEKAIRKNILLDADRRKILAQFEEKHIWYMPLKGALLKDWYPKLGMRQMSDNDILYDGDYQKTVRDIMTGLGFTRKHAGTKHDDAFFKQPVSNFEMHHQLFDPADLEGYTQIDFVGYFADIKNKLIKEEGTTCGYRFSNEDFYLYMIAHEYKHFISGGTGVRSLVDTYIFLRRFSDTLDWAYIHAELKKLSITEFEKNNRELAVKIMRREPLTENEEKLLHYYILSGTYGTIEHHINNRMEHTADNNKSKYLIHRLFPPLKHYEMWYPWAYKHKILLPAAWLFRLFRAATARRERIMSEFKYLKQ